jgi:glycosyltransferase involved in cell wall biosynthesis
MASHVLMIVENLPVPFDRRMWQEATTLLEAGYKVTVICPVGKGYTSLDETIDGVRILRHWLPDEGRGALGFIREYATALFHEFRLALKVWRSDRFDVVHVANPPDVLFLVALPFKLAKVRLVFDHHDLTPELYKEKFGKAGFGHFLMRVTEWLTFRAADVVISTNQSYRQIAFDRGGKAPSDVFVVRSSPKADQMRTGVVDPAIRARASVILGYVGIMGSQDGIDVLLDILARLISVHQVTDFHAVLIGDGPELEASKQRAVELGLSGHVTFTGYLSGKDLHNALCSIDIGLCPDPYNEYTRRCTMNKIMEYMAFSKPLVQFDLDEGRESAKDASLYAVIHDPDDFARQIMVLINDPAMRERMGRIGRERVEQHLNWSAEVPHLLAAYERALADRKARATVPVTQNAAVDPGRR